MKIGALVKSHLRSIFSYCEKYNHQEFIRLQDFEYSKELFNINYPFCIDINKISDVDPKFESKRYWREIYIVRGTSVRVSSQWFEYNKELFLNYLNSMSIPIQTENFYDSIDSNSQIHKSRNSYSNCRYKGNAIGNAQNQLIRNILSNLGSESFSSNDWKRAKDYFNNRCAYCGEKSELEMEHAIPINREKIGEHRLGNLVPSCKSCNKKKGNRDYKEFLTGNDEKIRQIEKYMDYNNYVPLDQNPQIKKILNMAYREVSDIAERYISIINDIYSS